MALHLPIRVVRGLCNDRHSDDTLRKTRRTPTTFSYSGLYYIEKAIAGTPTAHRPIFWLRRLPDQEPLPAGRVQQVSPDRKPPGAEEADAAGGGHSPRGCRRGQHKRPRDDPKPPTPAKRQARAPPTPGKRHARAPPQGQWRPRCTTAAAGDSGSKQAGRKHQSKLGDEFHDFAERVLVLLEEVAATMRLVLETLLQLSTSPASSSRLPKVSPGLADSKQDEADPCGSSKLEAAEPDLKHQFGKGDTSRSSKDATIASSVPSDMITNLSKVLASILSEKFNPYESRGKGAKGSWLPAVSGLHKVTENKQAGHGSSPSTEEAQLDVALSLSKLALGEKELPLPSSEEARSVSNSTSTCGREHAEIGAGTYRFPNPTCDLK